MEGWVEGRAVGERARNVAQSGTMGDEQTDQEGSRKGQRTNRKLSVPWNPRLALGLCLRQP